MHPVLSGVCYNYLFQFLLAFSLLSLLFSYFSFRFLLPFLFFSRPSCAPSRSAKIEDRIFILAGGCWACSTTSKGKLLNVLYLAFISLLLHVPLTLNACPFIKSIRYLDIEAPGTHPILAPYMPRDTIISFT